MNMLTLKKNTKMKKNEFNCFSHCGIICKDPNKMKEWYKRHLGLNANQYGTVFELNMKN